MNEVPKRKPIRIENYDYSTPGAYFITVCTANREKIFWSDRRGELCSPANVPLSDIGMIVNNEIQKLNTVYDSVRVDKYCIMPDHVHMIIHIDPNGRGELCSPADIPSLSRIVKQFKGCITKRIGFSIWQKTYYDHIVRNEEEYDKIKKYIEENTVKRLSRKLDRNDLTFIE